MSPHDIVGAFITVIKDNKAIEPRPDLTYFHRGREAIKNPKIIKLESILNLLRIFAIESFRYIPQFDLRNIHGEYFKDRIIFLMTLLEMVRTPFTEPNYHYIIKKYSSVWNVPRRAILIKNSTKLKIHQWDNIDRDQLEKTRARL